MKKQKAYELRKQKEAKKELMSQIAFFEPADVKFIEQCFANRQALEVVLDAKLGALRVDKDALGKIATVSEVKNYRNAILWSFRIREKLST